MASLPGIGNKRCFYSRKVAYATLSVNMRSKEYLPSQEELTEPAVILAQTFIQRWDLYARQLDDGHYVCVHEPLTHDRIEAHLNGNLTLGTYILDSTSQARFLVIDADDERNWQQLTMMAKALAEKGIPGYLENSRLGGHLWFFFSEPLSGRLVRSFGKGLLSHYKVGKIELFPKQDRLISGPGSLIRLPFGIHRKTGRRYGFHLPNGSLLAPTMREQIYAFRDVQTVSKDAFAHFSSHSANTKPKGHFKPLSRLERKAQDSIGELPVSERIKAAVSVRQFVSQYVELSEDGRGLCPFHDDQVASFSIDDKRNYWHCFACGMGGSIIDFWIQWRSCSFREALRELAAILL